MSADHEVKFPLRPAVLVIAADKDYQGKSLAEITARNYSSNMKRLTEKFSKRCWDIPTLDMNDDDAAMAAWKSTETVNMAILSGYTGSEAQKAELETLRRIKNPIITLVTISEMEDLPHVEEREGFEKALILPANAGLEDQFKLTNKALKQARQENCWEEYTPRMQRLPEIAPASSSKIVH